VFGISIVRCYFFLWCNERDCMLESTKRHKLNLDLPVNVINFHKLTDKYPNR
jgi:hypothetical protein